MSDSDSQFDPLRFTDAEIDILGRTADAMSAWMGKPVLAQVVDSLETGYEWVLFGVPLMPDQDATDITVVQVGGPGARLIGNKGGLSIADGDFYDCEYLWAVQLSDIEGIRFIKIDADGEEIAWTNDLTEIVPFDLSDIPPDTHDADTDEDGDDDSSYGTGDQGKPDNPTLH